MPHSLFYIYTIYIYKQSAYMLSHIQKKFAAITNSVESYRVYKLYLYIPDCLPPATTNIIYSAHWDCPYTIWPVRIHTSNPSSIYNICTKIQHSSVYHIYIRLFKHIICTFFFIDSRAIRQRRKAVNKLHQYILLCVSVERSTFLPITTYTYERPHAYEFSQFSCHRNGASFICSCLEFLFFWYIGCI